MAGNRDLARAEGPTGRILEERGMLNAIMINGDEKFDPRVRPKAFALKSLRLYSSLPKTAAAQV